MNNLLILLNVEYDTFSDDYPIFGWESFLAIGIILAAYVLVGYLVWRFILRPIISWAWKRLSIRISRHVKKDTPTP